MNLLSKTSKMPCHSYSTSAELCATGRVLQKNPNSVCHGCYALKNFYRMPNVKAAQERRMKTYHADPDLWKELIILEIKEKEKSGHFRWFDSGDLANYRQLQLIVEIAEELPHIKFWLPTKEYTLVTCLKTDGIRPPDNLTIRVSHPLVDKNVKSVDEEGIIRSSTVSDKKQLTGYQCPASTQGNKCASCRACWDRGVENVVYKKH